MTIRRCYGEQRNSNRLFRASSKNQAAMSARAVRSVEANSTKPRRTPKRRGESVRSRHQAPITGTSNADEQVRPYVKASYEALVGRGKKKMQAIGALMRK
ncbi:hypothetical protein [Stutzerimonas stutzeri]|uniref:hypothetical protein n=1 Tax=Stutzerimonas stutzeri TaxID=316 RepID=UPI00210D1429|nr:hypothetical protein [Stutzerimonas stutzeri]MCQ4320227.1 hypothetical protein [Stutzerimonas stutzeri]